MARAKSGTLAAATVTPVAVDVANPTGVTVVNRTGTATIWVNPGGDASVGGDDCIPVYTSTWIPCPDLPDGDAYDGVTLSLYCAVAQDYTVVGKPKWRAS